MWLAIASLTVLSLLLLWRIMKPKATEKLTKTVTVVVLGDLDRSPRMRRHVERFERHGWFVNVVSDTEGKDTEFRKYYRVWYPPIPPNASRWVFLLLAPLKILFNTLSLLFILLFWINVRSSWILVQNPPSLPTLPIVQLVAYVRSQRLIIDWHNTGYSILSLRLGRRSTLVKLAEWLEKLFGRKADLHLFVSYKMLKDMTLDFKLVGKKILLYDRPPASLHRLSPVERKDFLKTFSLTAHVEKEEKEALLVSSTSWTADEDFSLLIETLDIYDKEREKLKLPKILVCVTGKGGVLKSEFEKEVKKRQWGGVRVWTGWLSKADYEKLLGSSDLGISLHQSSSGFDLPMKVVDMFGCGLPVCALKFSSIDELVLEGKNGHVFSTHLELKDLFNKLLQEYPSFPSELDVLRAGIEEGLYGAGDGLRRWMTWEEEWDSTVGRTLDIVHPQKRWSIPTPPNR